MWLHFFSFFPDLCFWSYCVSGLTLVFRSCLSDRSGKGPLAFCLFISSLFLCSSRRELYEASHTGTVSVWLSGKSTVRQSDRCFQKERNGTEEGRNLKYQFVKTTNVFFEQQSTTTPATIQVYVLAVTAQQSNSTVAKDGRETPQYSHQEFKVVA